MYVKIAASLLCTLSLSSIATAAEGTEMDNVTGTCIFEARGDKFVIKRCKMNVKLDTGATFQVPIVPEQQHPVVPEQSLHEGKPSPKIPDLPLSSQAAEESQELAEDPVEEGEEEALVPPEEEVLLDEEPPADVEQSPVPVKPVVPTSPKTPPIVAKRQQPAKPAMTPPPVASRPPQPTKPVPGGSSALAAKQKAERTAEKVASDVVQGVDQVLKDKIKKEVVEELASQ